MNRDQVVFVIHTILSAASVGLFVAAVCVVAYAVEVVLR